MNSNEWPLVFFTLLSQMSAGILLAGFAVFAVTKNSELSGSPELRKWILTAAIVMLGAALLLSFLHLSRPLHSLYAFSNIGTSFLSREILTLLLFLVFLLLAWFSNRYGHEFPVFQKTSFLAALLSGLLLILFMARLYMIPTVPAWNTPLTVVGFFNSAVLLGALALLIFIPVLHTKGFEMYGLQKMANILFIMLALGCCVQLLVNLIPHSPDETLTSSFPLPVIHWGWKVAGIFFLLAGFSLLAWWYAGFMEFVAATPTFWLYLGFLLLFASEVAGRFIFYASYYRVGV